MRKALTDYSDHNRNVCVLVTDEGIGAYTDFNTMIVALNLEGLTVQSLPGTGWLFVDGDVYGQFFGTLPIESGHE